MQYKPISSLTMVFAIIGHQPGAWNGKSLYPVQHFLDDTIDRKSVLH